MLPRHLQWELCREPQPATHGRESLHSRCFSNLKDGSPVPEERNNGFKVTAQWHSDGSYRPIPDHACAIFAERVAEWGGQTCWANLFAAYRSLPDRLKELLEGPEAQCSDRVFTPIG